MTYEPSPYKAAGIEGNSTRLTKRHKIQVVRYTDRELGKRKGRKSPWRKRP